MFNVAAATQLDIVLGVNFVRDLVVIAFIPMESLSILENVALAGVLVPKLIINALEVLNKTDDKDDE